MIFGLEYRHRIKQQYVPYTRWECVPAGLWRQGAVTAEQLETALLLMRDTHAWGHAMCAVVEAWPHTMLHHLSDYGHNRIAWLGQASVCFALTHPMQVTKQAWWALTDKQREEANRQAFYAIHGWESANAELYPSRWEEISTKIEKDLLSAN